MSSPSRLASPEEARPVSRREMVASGLCIGCGACLDGEGQMRWDRHGQLKPSGPAEWLSEPSPSFARICPFSPTAADERALAAHLFPTARHRDERVGPFDAAYVGHARDGFREKGSSGGLVSWVAAELLRQGLVDGVAHVVAVDEPEEEGRHFRYRISRGEAAVRAGAKSRYYPIELSAVLDEIRSVPGRYAVVGIPCFIKAVNLLRAEDERLSSRIAFTLGLYCGHMKSARMVESFAWQMGLKSEEVERIDFRLKDPSRPANWYRAEITRRDGSREAQDWWHLVDGDWGAGFFQNGACDFCDDVVAETADISFGDAWVEPYSSDGRGTNVVIVRSPEVHRLIQRGIGDGRLDLAPVDADFVEQTQAAGFRQRREGLAYRLSWRRRGVHPLKRVDPSSRGLPLRRKLIYRMRHHIAVWSHRVFHLARRLNWPTLYLGWARAVLTVYQGLTYSRGPVGRIVDRLEAAFGARAP